MNGRGAYIHASQECLKKALKGNLDKAKELYKEAHKLARENYNTSIANLAKERYENIH